MHNKSVDEWLINQTVDLEAWFLTLDEPAQVDILAAVRVLSKFGPSLSRPHVDTLKGSQYSNLKELRVQSNGRPFRIAFAFDPAREGILLLGGNKKGIKRFYEDLIDKADEIYGRHLEEIKNEKSKKPKEKKRKK